MDCISDSGIFMEIMLSVQQAHVLRLAINQAEYGVSVDNGNGDFIYIRNSNRRFWYTCRYWRGIDYDSFVCAVDDR